MISAVDAPWILRLKQDVEEWLGGSSIGTSYPTSNDAEVPLQDQFRQTGNLVHFNLPRKQVEVVNEENEAYAQNIDSGRIVRVTNMIIEGLSVNKMLEREWGITSPGGAYQAALVELRETQKAIALQLAR